MLTENTMVLVDGFFRQYPARLYRKNTIIFDAGQLPQGLFYVISGRVKLASTDSKGQERIYYTLGPTDPFPLAPFFLSEAQATSYTAITDVRAIWRPHEEVNEFLNKHPQALREIIGLVLRAFYSRVQDLSFSTSERRVVNRLVYLAQRFGEPCEAGLQVDVTQQELANSINLTRESISLVLNRLQAVGVVRLHRSKICVDMKRAIELITDEG